MGLLSYIRDTLAPKQQGNMEQSDLSVNRLLDFVNKTGDNRLLDVYGIGVGQRFQALHFAVFFRVITLLSSVIAQLLTTGGLRVVDRDGNIDKSTATMRLLDLLEHSPDGETPSYQFITDWCIDYLIDGNGLLSIQKTNGKVSSLRRLEGFSAQIDYTSNGEVTYRAHDAYATDKTEGKLMVFPDMNIIHARFGLLMGTGSHSTTRNRFATPPVTLLRPALSIGLESDKYILDYYKTDSPKSNVGISIQKSIAPNQLEQFYTQFERAATTRAPLLFGEGATFTNLNNTSSGSSTQAVQREFQVGEICRVYGVPGPLVNQQVTSWGSGIEQLSKLFYRFGLRQHVEAMLSPMKMKLLKPGFQFRLDEVDLLRGDTAGIAAILTATKGDAQSPEIATVQERRRFAGLPINPEYGELQPLMMRYPNNPPDNEDDNGTETD